MSQKITDNTAKSRFELVESNEISYADYDRKGDVLSIKYVFSPEALRGSGAAGRLMEGIAGIAKSENVKVYPICGYAVAWLKKHPDHNDIIA